MIKPGDACPKLVLRMSAGNASHSAPITNPTFKQAPAQTFWNPTATLRIAAETSNNPEIAPINALLI